MQSWQGFFAGVTVGGPGFGSLAGWVRDINTYSRKEAVHF
jgi:hypothetical protein